MIIKDLDIKIKSTISRLDWTQTVFAEHLDISKRSLNNMIETKEVVKLDTFIKLCKVLELSPAYLLSESTNSQYEDSQNLDKQRILMEIEFKNLKNEIEKKAFVVPYKSNQSFKTIFTNKILEFELKNFMNIHFPHYNYSNQEIKIFHPTKDLLNIYYSNIVEEGDILFCSKVEDISTLPEDIPLFGLKEESIYVSLNSEAGRTISKVSLDQSKENINFYMAATFMRQVTETISYTLPKDKVYEIWKLEVLVKSPSTESLDGIYCEELKVFK